MEEEKVLGTQETKDVLKFVISMGEALDKSLADGKMDATELALLIPPLMQLAPALDGIKDVSKELSDLTSVEMSELVTYVKDDLDLKNDNIEKIIEDGLGLSLKVYTFIKLFSKKS